MDVNKKDLSEAEIRTRFITPAITSTAGWDVVQIINRTPQQLSGVLGALGVRINKSEGLKDKGSISIVLEITANPNGNWCYKMRPILQKALEQENLL